MADDLTTRLIKERESYRSKPYWDKNAWRIGYGSDTITLEDGTFKKIGSNPNKKPKVTVNRAGADRDLARRIPEFQRDGIIAYVGQDAWDALDEGAKAAVTSLAYNYGSLDGLPSLQRAVRSGDNQRIADAIVARGGDNDGINDERRRIEASYVLGHPVPPGSIPDVASETDTTPPSPMPARPFGNTRPEDRLDAMLPDQAMFGLKPGGPGPEEMTPGLQTFATGGLDSQQHWGGMTGYNPETRQFETPEVGDALRTALMPKVPAVPQGPAGRRPPPAPSVSPPTLNDTRREQNTTYRPAPPAAAAPPPLPRARPEPPLGFDPLPAPAPLVPQAGVDPVGAGPGSYATFSGLLNDMTGTEDSVPTQMPDLTPSGRPMWFTSRPPGEPASPEPEEAAFVPKADPKTFDVLPKGPMGRGGIRGDTTPLIARPVTTIAMDPLTNQPLAPTLAPGPRAAAPMPLTPSPLLRQSGPPPIPVMPRMPPPALRSSPSDGAIGDTYTVRRGDTLSGIAERSGMSLVDILGLNPQIWDPDRITAGSSLNMGGHSPDGGSVYGQPTYPRNSPPPVPAPRMGPPPTTGGSGGGYGGGGGGGGGNIVGTHTGTTYQVGQTVQNSRGENVVITGQTESGRILTRPA